MDLKLIQLDENVNTEIYDMLQDIPANENGLTNPMNGKTIDEFAVWLRNCNLSSQQVGIVDNWRVPQTIYWLFDGNRPVGFGKLRHLLTERLLLDGGSIGYSIRPDSRGKGYGKELLRLLLTQCRDKGIDEVLLTIKKNNIASIKAAYANGGVLKEETDSLLYIWITC